MKPELPMKPERTPQSLHLTTDMLEGFVSQGTLVAFLGAGASSLRDPHKKSIAGTMGGLPDWGTLFGRYEALAGKLPDDRTRRYVRKVIEAHHVAFPPTPAAKSPAPHLRLQVPLARLGSFLATEVGLRLAAAERSPTHVMLGQAPLEADAAEVAFGHFKELFEALEGMGGRAEEPHFFPVGVITTRLATLGCILFSADAFEQRAAGAMPAGSRQAIRRTCGEFRERYKDREVGYGLRQLHWLDSFLWHTLRWDLPAYPTTSELAFQLSLLPPLTVIPTNELAELAELAKPDELLEWVAAIFRFYERRGAGDNLSVHRVIARLLLMEYGRKSRTTRHAKDMLTICFTTNFDCELERALGDHPYHVVFPITTSGVGPDYWLMTTVSPAGVSTLPILLNPQDEKDLRGFPVGEDGEEIAIQGPIIVKLHGSPMDAVPLAVAKSDGVVARLTHKHRHYLVLSESSFLGSAYNPEALPDWIEEYLNEPSSGGTKGLWFLGYSISDWNVRLWLYRYLANAQTASRVATLAKKAEKYAVSRSFEPEKSRVLSNLDVKFVPDSLENFADVLDRALALVEKTPAKPGVVA